ncbi:MAG: amidohydrolase/deacetylase family metallohydrolase, partial [Chloroflexi bacterium]|nr:amidohydrolase/deacetylase family metallohydrolase [Chloroflexota bacterium]
GRVIDPGRGFDGVADVAIRSDRIMAVEPNIELANAGTRHVLDAAGLIVVPGLIDVHTHLFAGVAPLGVEADPNCLGRGVTTAVDAGSSGGSTFPAFRRYVIEVATTRILAMLHISSIGMAREDSRGDQAVGELEPIGWAHPELAVEVAKANPDKIIGIKVRLSIGQVGTDPENCRAAIRLTREAADKAGLPAMIHIGSTTIPLDEILSYAQKGDLVTHVFHGRPEGILNEKGTVKKSVRDAIERGVTFDVGHGKGSFSWQVARAALEQGLLPGTISSDIHSWSLAGPAYDLATTASKFLHLGVPLTEVLRRITETPARVIGHSGYLGTLAPDAAADVTVLREAEGEWPFTDCHRQTEIGRLRLEPVAVVRAGQVYPCAPSVYYPPA